MTDTEFFASQDATYVYIPYVSREGTGMQRFCSETTLALARAGVDVRILIGQMTERPDWLDGLRYHVIIGPRLAGRLPRQLLPALRVLWLQLLFPRLARRGTTLLALAHELPPRPAIRQLAVVHDLTHRMAHSARPGLAERLRDRLWMAGLKQSVMVAAISEATKRDLLASVDLPPERVVVIHEGYDPKIFHAGRRDHQRRPFLLYAGTLAPNKNIPFLLDVFARLHPLADIDLVLAGKQDPAVVEALRSRVPEECRRRVEFAGFVTDEALAHLMRGCVAFVFPSLNEGFGLAPVEAMACAAPVVSSDAGSLLEVIGTGGVLLRPDDADGWVAELTRVVTDPAYREVLSRRAVERSAAFSWNRGAHEYRRLIIGARGKDPADLGA